MRLSSRRLASIAPFLAASVLSLALLGCGDGGARVPSWGGQALPIVARVERPVADALRGTAMERAAAFAPRSLWRVGAGEWGDSLALVEFADPLTAFAAFQELAAAPEDAPAGTTVRAGHVCFRRGRWIGSVPDWSWRGAAPFDTALGLPGGARIEELPEAFASMLHQERFAGSERVLTRDVLGGAVGAPALAVALDCSGDTAWLYASISASFASTRLQALGWKKDGREDALFFRENPEMPPATVLFSKRGAVAVEGCFDPERVKNWIKHQYSGLNDIEKSLNTLKSLSFD
jgi:hypothetical protein